MRYIAVAIIFFYACATGPRPGEPSRALSRGPIAAEALLVHAGYLAGDSLYGRAAGSPHELQAAEYIRREFIRYGLEPVWPRQKRRGKPPDPGGVPFGDRPAVSDYFQSFSFIARFEMGPGNAVSWTREGVGEQTALEPDVDFRPLGFSASGYAEGGLVFAGYGISSTDPEYDDYIELGVAGKVVMLLRYSPDGTNLYGAFGEHTPLRKKVLIARENGAAAVILVTGPADDEEDYLMTLRYDRGGGDAGLPVVNLTREAADRLLAAEHLTIAELQQEINNTRMPLSHKVTGLSVSITTDLVPQEAESRNVLAALPGTGSLKGQWAVLGAHYDHLGWGGPGSGSMVPDTIAIHNGADDNASGTATLLELARYLAANPPGGANRRSIIFQAFGAEERGTLGSVYVTKHSPVPMDSVVAMVNLDMVGGLTEGNLVIGGAGTSSLWKELLPTLNSDSLNLVYDEGGYGSSDHQSYYLQDKPVLFFFTGEHEHYHRPSDDVEFLNLGGMAQVGQLVARVAVELATRPQPPAFTKVETSRPATRGGFAVAVGTIPDFTWDGEGFRISDIRGGGPADKRALQAAKAGVPVTIVVKRGEGVLDLEVVPERRRN